MPRPRRKTEAGETISRTRKKRDAAALKIVGERLTELSDDALNRIEMPEDLREAVRFARTIASHGARRRQIQLIGKLLRETDADPIREALENVDRIRGNDVRRFRRTESARDAIAAGDGAALETAAARLAETLRPELERLADAARRERSGGQPRGAGRALFRFLMKHDAQDGNRQSAVNPTTDY